MSASFSHRNRIGVPVRPDGSPDDPDRVEIGPTPLAFAEWAERGIAAPNLERMREYRLQRVCEQLRERDYGAALLFDPMNIRYATDSSNMHVWILHNPARAVFVSADGHVVLWDFHRCDHLSSYLPLVREVRCGAAFFYFETGDKTEAVARQFVGEIDELLREHAGSNRRLAVDRMEIDGILALQAAGIEIRSGWQMMEHARVIKSEDEVNAMRCAIDTCERAMGVMHQHLAPGTAENELWGAPALRERSPRRRMDRDAHPEFRPAHQPVDAGERAAAASRQRTARLRHRSHRPLRHVCGSLAHLVLRRRAAVRRAASAVPACPRAHRDQHRTAQARYAVPRTRVRRASAAGFIPAAALRREDARRRSVRRVPGHLLPRGTTSRARSTTTCARA